MKTTETISRKKIESYLKRSEENISSLAKNIGINPPTLYNFMNKRASITLRTLSKVEEYIDKKEKQ